MVGRFAPTLFPLGQDQLLEGNEQWGVTMGSQSKGLYTLLCEDSAGEHGRGGTKKA